MRKLLSILCLVVFTALVFGGDKRELPQAKTCPSFDKLKALEGSWNGKDETGKPVTVTYKVMSAGTSVMESLDMGDHGTMVTMYTTDGSHVMLTHYCSLGNQPNMKCSKASADGNTLHFAYSGGANISGKKDTYMKALDVTFTDADHFTQAWSLSEKGVMGHPMKMEFERAK
ncbi:MAG TPA: hypothetical protein VKS81_01325 [Bacteroidota bacterium]|nr:hypothetical protein [Bacteroidota bacterium]